jgi:hypothetical protein
MNWMFACFLALATAFAQEPVPSDVPVVEAPAAEAPAPAVEAPAAEVAPEAVVPPATDGEAVEVAVSMVEAFKAGQIPFGVGFALTLLVYLVSRFGLTAIVSEKVVPILAFLVGAAGSVSAGLLSGVPVLDAIITGVLAGVAAVGGWEAIAKVFTSSASAEASKA